MTRPRQLIAAVLSTILVDPTTLVEAFGAIKTPVSTLLSQNADQIAQLKEAAKTVASSDAPSDDVFYLRYVLEEYESDADRLNALASTMKWRVGDGKSICDAAKAAVEKASSGGPGTWDNEPVRAAAPFAESINQYITPSQIITTSTAKGDLVYCVRAGQIDDVSLMSKVTSEQMVDFFLYCKEVNAIVANAKSAECDNLLRVIVANDLAGVKLIGGDATFRNALSASSKQAAPMYPASNGPSLLLNLPGLLGALVKLFTPLFPKKVQERIVFAQGPLAGIGDLTDVLPGGSGRDKFMNYLDDLVYKDA